MQRRSRFFWSNVLVITAVSMLVIVIATIFAGRTISSATTDTGAAKGDKAAGTAALTVEVAAVARGVVATTVSATGTVSAWQEVTLSAETNGLAVIDVAVMEGSKVAQGQLLARLNDGLLKAQVAEQQAAVTEAEASLEKAKSANDRAEKLLAKEAISRETAEGALTDLKTGQAKLAQAQAVLEKLKVQLGQIEIRSPVDGYVSEPPVVVGTVAQNGTELFHIVSGGRLELAAKIPEQYLAEITQGQRVEVTGAAGVTVDGTVRAVASKVDSATRLGTIYVALPEDAPLRQGMFARAVISIKSDTVLNVPQSAVVWRDGKPYVFVLGANNIVALRSVELGARSVGQVAVTSGLTEGEQVVTSGGGFLNDGNTVRLAAAAADADEKVRSEARR